MITSINKENANRYTALFEKATTELAAANKIQNNWKISNLEDYFSVIVELKDLDKKYTILPLDEDYFEIDANARTIKVPDSFKKHGIAVKGDQVAEIIYFKINRYFDFTDLDQTDIYIQWERTNKINGAKQDGISTYWVKDVESDPDYLIFGWPLSSDITAEEGILRFSVRFIQWSDPEENETGLNTRTITYSFSTLEAQATIQNALDFKEDKLVLTDNINAMIANRIRNSSDRDSGIAKEPEFNFTLIDNENIVDNGNNYYTVDLINGSYVFKANARSTDAGLITYSWTREGLNGGINNLTGNDSYVKIDFEKEPQALPNKIYYKYDSNLEKYIAVPEIKEGDSLDTNILEFEPYEYYNTCTATGTGRYTVTAQNRINKHTASITSETVTIPGPNSSTFSPNGQIGLILNNSNNFTITLEPAITNNSTTALTYQWYKNQLPIESEEGKAATYTVNNEQGNYYLKVTATKNGDSIDTCSEQFVVTYTAATPIVTIDSDSNFFVVGDSVAINVKYNETYQNNANIEEYQWYTCDSNGVELNALDGENKNIFEPKTTGLFICRVTNKYNTTTAIGHSPIVVVSNQ